MIFFFIGLDPNTSNFDGLTALHQSCIDGSDEMVMTLLEHGASVNAQDRDGWTPLHAAATCGHLSIVNILLDEGADLLAINGDGDLPYDITEDDETLKVIEKAMTEKGITNEMVDRKRAEMSLKLREDAMMLIKGGHNLDMPVNEDGATLLHVAIVNNVNEVARLLLENGASNEVEDVDGWRPAHAAAYWGNIEALHMLAEKNTNLRAETDTGRVPYDLADDPATRSKILELINSNPVKYADRSSSLSDSDYSDDFENNGGALTFVSGTTTGSANDDSVFIEPGMKIELQDSSIAKEAETQAPPVLERVESISQRQNSIRRAKKMAVKINLLSRQEYDDSNDYDNSYELKLMGKTKSNAPASVDSSAQKSTAQNKSDRLEFIEGRSDSLESVGQSVNSVKDQMHNEVGTLATTQVQARDLESHDDYTEKGSIQTESLILPEIQEKQFQESSSSEDETQEKDPIQRQGGLSDELPQDVSLQLQGQSNDEETSQNVPRQGRDSSSDDEIARNVPEQLEQVSSSEEEVYKPTPTVPIYDDPPANIQEDNVYEEPQVRTQIQYSQEPMNESAAKSQPPMPEPRTIFAIEQTKPHKEPTPIHEESFIDRQRQESSDESMGQPEMTLPPATRSIYESTSSSEHEDTANAQQNVEPKPQFALAQNYKPSNEPAFNPLPETSNHVLPKTDYTAVSPSYQRQSSLYENNFEQDNARIKELKKSYVPLADTRPKSKREIIRGSLTDLKLKRRNSRPMSFTENGPNSPSYGDIPNSPTYGDGPTFTPSPEIGETKYVFRQTEDERKALKSNLYKKKRCSIM